MFKKLFLVTIIIFLFSNRVLAYTEQPNSPENLINVLSSDFNINWITEDDLLTIHNEDEYLLGLLTDYVIVKDIVNENIGTNFSIQDNNLKMYQIFEQVGLGQKSFFERYTNTLDLLNSEYADKLVTPTLNYLVNKYGNYSEDIVGNSYGYFTKAYAIHNLIKSFNDPNQLVVPREITNTVLTFAGTSAGAVAGAYTNFLFKTISTMEEITARNRIYLYSALYFEAKKVNEENIYFNENGTLKPTSSMYNFFTNEQIQTFYNFTETDELTNSQYNEVTAEIIRTPMENIPLSQVEIFDIIDQSQSYLNFIKSYLNLLNLYGYYNWSNLLDHLDTKISNQLSIINSLRNNISTDVLKVSQKDENGLVTIINTTDKEIHSVYLVDKDLILDDKSEVTEKINPFSSIVIDASSLVELNELHYNIVGMDETLVLDTFLPEVVSNINISSDQFVTYNAITFNAPSNIILEPNVVYDWYYGDGETQTVSAGQSVTHSYEIAKTYSVRLVIKKDSLVVDDISTSLKIEENETIKPTNPIISQSATNYSIGDSITFSATSNSSIDSNTIEYHWYNAKSNLFIASSPSIEITTTDESYEAYYVIAKNIHGESEAKYAYIYENSSNGGTVEKPTFIYDRYTRTNSNNSTETIDEYTIGINVFGNIELISGNLTLTDNVEVSGNFLEKSGTLDLNGYSLTINGNFIQSGGNVKINNGELIVKGDYLIQKPQEDGTYTDSSGILHMESDNDYVLVEGSFVADGARRTYSCSNNSFIAGVLEVKGDFYQKSTDSVNGGSCSFNTAGTHKVILSGSNKQIVSFDRYSPSSSHFNILELKNTSEEGIEFITQISIVGNLISNNTKVTGLSNYGEYIAKNNNVINGDFTHNGWELDLNGYSLTINGNFIQSGGSVKINNGELIVKGDYLIQKPQEDGTYEDASAKLYMENENDYVLVEGVFLIDTRYDHSELLTAGLLEVKGDFTQSGIDTSNSSSKSFHTSGTHKVILSGNNKQIVSFEDPSLYSSHFNILELKNTSEEGIEFITQTSISNNLISNDTKVVGLSNYGGYIVKNNNIINGDYSMGTGTLDLNGYSLTINGNFIQSGGNVKINNGELIVKGDYLIQKPQEDGTYDNANAKLYMESDNDYILVEGSFLIDTRYDHSELLTAGLLEIKGDFTQSKIDPNNSNNLSLNATGTNKVILSGTTKQTVSFDSPGPSRSHFNILELKNTSSEGIEFLTYTYVIDELIANNCQSNLDFSNVIASLLTFDNTCYQTPIINRIDNITLFEDSNYSKQVTLSEGSNPITYSLSIVPSNYNISINQSGLITGSNLQIGDYTLTLRAENEAGIDEISWVLNIVESSPEIVVTYSWQIGNWSNCQGTCGTNNAIQTRTVQCKSSLGDIVSDTMCTDIKPITSQSCTASICTVPPQANAGNNQSVEQYSYVTLNANGSSDSDGTIVSYEWKEGNTLLSTSQSFSKSDFSVGTHAITLTVIDSDGLSDSDMVTITIISPSALTLQTAFIERFYQNILSRTADSGGMNTWLDVIQNQSAAKVAWGFFNSQEFINLGLSNEEFVDILYQTLFDRVADSGGREGWLSQLSNGISRTEVIYGFLNAQEFANLANNFGVTQIRPIDQISGVNGYVNRFYSLVLGREADQAGFDDWTSQLNAGTKAGGDIAKGFFNSTEYLNRGLGNSDFLDICYRAFFNREADAGGKSNWLSQLELGATNDDILNGFIGSQEFLNLTIEYGIQP